MTNLPAGGVMRMVEPAVYYRTEDYLGVMRRLLIDAVDTTVAAIVSMLLSTVAWFVTPEPWQGLAVLLIWTGVWIGYFVFLKGSRLPR